MSRLAFALAGLASIAASAQEASAPAPAEQAAARFTLDTPIEELARDPRARAVLERRVPTLGNPVDYEIFKRMSLNELKSYASHRLTEARLRQIAAELAAIR